MVLQTKPKNMLYKKQRKKKDINQEYSRNRYHSDDNDNKEKAKVKHEKKKEKEKMSRIFTKSLQKSF